KHRDSRSLTSLRMTSRGSPASIVEQVVDQTADDQQRHENPKPRETAATRFHTDFSHAKISIAMDRSCVDSGRELGLQTERHRVSITFPASPGRPQLDIVRPRREV